MPLNTVIIRLLDQKVIESPFYRPKFPNMAGSWNKPTGALSRKSKIFSINVELLDNLAVTVALRI